MSSLDTVRVRSMYTYSIKIWFETCHILLIIVYVYVCVAIYIFLIYIRVLHAVRTVDVCVFRSKIEDVVLSEYGESGLP